MDYKKHLTEMNTNTLTKAFTRIDIQIQLGSLRDLGINMNPRDYGVETVFHARALQLIEKRDRPLYHARKKAYAECMFTLLTVENGLRPDKAIDKIVALSEL